MTVSLVVIIIYIILYKGVLSIHLDNTPLHILLNKLSPSGEEFSKNRRTYVFVGIYAIIVRDIVEFVVVTIIKKI